MSESEQLPVGWCWRTVEELATLVQYGSSAKTDEGPEGVPVLRMGNIVNGSIDPTDLKFLPPTHDEFPSLLLNSGDLLFNRTNSAELVGKTAVYTGSPKPCSFASYLIRVRLSDACQPKFLAAFINSIFGRKWVKSVVNQQVGQANVNGSKLKALRVPLPPSLEQSRIVAAIEQHFSGVDAGVASLERALANLKRYRASVLKAACEGRLVPTEAELARKERRDYEPADALLRRILQERRTRWEADQLAKMKAKGQEPRAERWKAKYEEPTGPDKSALAELPAGWAWSNLRSIAEIKGGITKGQKRSEGEAVRLVPYLRVANVQRGYLDLGEVKEIEATEAEIEELRLREGDVLFNEGGDRDKLGRGWIWQQNLPICIHQNHVFRARLMPRTMEPKLVSWYGNSFGQKYFIDEGKQTTNLASINMTKLGALPIPIPPLAEQKRIVAEVDRLLSLADETEQIIRTQLARAEKLRQSVLKRAFEGKLVPQDPNDEPASVLLERIRAERSAEETKPRKSPKSTKKPRSTHA